MCPKGTTAPSGRPRCRNTAPAQDYTTGSIPGSPDAPAWPPIFAGPHPLASTGRSLLGQLALQPGKHPGIVVVHGFNTHGIASVIRWAAMLAANGYNVLAADQRNFSFEYSAGDGYPDWLQTFGWKEAEDALAMGRFPAAQPGVSSIGVVGWSLGAQDTVLALALDGREVPSRRVFSAGLQWSGPADQNTQIYSTAVPPACQTPACTRPATDALIAVVVPPYTEATSARRSRTRRPTIGRPYAILTHEADLSRAGARAGALARLLRGRRPAGATIPRDHDGRLPGGESAATHARDFPRQPCLFLRSMVAATGRSAVLQDGAARGEWRHSDRDDADRESHAGWRTGALAAHRSGRTDARVCRSRRRRPSRP
mgnify:CR=1 FL=1